ncbi:hypothetical protein PVK06_024027 [Gossypium arboreum]|uniref:Uncharacterized protein n=1 Tax=Gossypium arboreum TaxID=29729 RepID=A0ABR0PD29_GOSAR|nr:hypothetical protein PVK06_024027 [Gossypium arboreum]
MARYLDYGQEKSLTRGRSHSEPRFAKLIKDSEEGPSQMEWRSRIANGSSYAHRKGSTDGGFTSRFIMV